MYTVGKERVPFFAACGKMHEILYKGEVQFVISGPEDHAQNVVNKLNKIAAWEMIETGGGCTAWRYRIDLNNYLLITQDASADLDMKQPIEIGLYDDRWDHGEPIDYAEVNKL